MTVPPEEALLAASLLIKPDRVAEVRDKVKPSDIYGDLPRAVVEAVTRRVEVGEPCDLVLLVPEIADRLRLAPPEVETALKDLCQQVPHGAASSYAKTVKRAALLREGARLGHAIAGGAALDGQPERLAAIRDALAGLDRPANALTGPRRFSELLAEARAMREVPEIPSSTPGLNVGYRPGHTRIIGGFTGEGKTTMAVYEAAHHAAAGRPVLFLALELSGPEVAGRVSDAIQDDPGAPVDLPLWIDDRAVTLPDVLRTVSRWAGSLGDASEGPPVLIVDYLQKVEVIGAHSREREVAPVAEGLSRLVRRLGLIAVCAAQLNRQSQADERGPALHHLRESGLLEQVADVVLLLSKIADDRLRVTLAKNRWGPAGSEVELAVDFRRCRFAPLGPGETWRPLVDGVLDYFVRHSGETTVREICRSIKIRGKHPRAKDVTEAAVATRRFRVWDGIVTPSPP